MKRLFVYQIVDTLSQTILHTVLASSEDHARAQFNAFLGSLKGKIHESDFYLVTCGFVDVFEAYKDAHSFIFDSVNIASVCNGSEVIADES